MVCCFFLKGFLRCPSGFYKGFVEFYMGFRIVEASIAWRFVNQNRDNEIYMLSYLRNHPLFDATHRSFRP